MRSCYCGECPQCLSYERKECRKLRDKRRRQSGPKDRGKFYAKADTWTTGNGKDNSLT
jgi:Zn-dependent alcohol dehydrogenase